MAKYIDVDEVLKHIARFRKTLEHDIHVSCTEVSKVEVIEDCIKQQPPANVIEKEKVDKAIEEIEQTLYVDSLIFGELIDFKDGKISADDVIEEFNRVTRIEVLEILKRNMGL